MAAAMRRCGGTASKPVLTLICLAAFTLILGLEPSRAADAPTADALGAFALSLANDSRQEAGLSPMREARTLMQAAQSHADDMAKRRYLAHVSPTGETAFDRYLDAGGNRWDAIAENIGLCGNCGSDLDYDDIRKIHQGWMSSASHRDNILSPALTQFGFGIAQDDAGKAYAVEMFAGAAGEQPTVRAVKPGEEVERFFALINRDRAQRGVRKIRPKASLNEAANRALVNVAEPLHADVLLQIVRRVVGKRWRSLATIVGVCGGCGTQVTEADVDTFYTRWMNNPDYREKLMNPDFSAAGFAMRAGEDGRKIALSLIGAPGRASR
jgi:uncharacterized protein YkwD